MEILRGAAYRRMPWKNGGGETLEIAASPPDATFDTLDWRVSMATVAQDGPFSIFPGVDRTLCVLEGAGLELDFGEHGDTKIVTTASAPLSFAADYALQARLLAGPITDLNVMTRRDRCRHSVHPLAIGAEPLQVSAAEQSLVFCEHREVICTLDGVAEIRLDARDCLLIRSAPTVITIRTAQSLASIYLIQFYPTAATRA